MLLFIFPTHLGTGAAACISVSTTVINTLKKKTTALGKNSIKLTMDTRTTFSCNNHKIYVP